MRNADPIVPDRSVVIFLSEIDDLPCKTESLLSSFHITDGLRSKISKIGIDQEIFTSLIALLLILPLPFHKVPEVLSRVIGV